MPDVKKSLKKRTPGSKLIALVLLGVVVCALCTILFSPRAQQELSQQVESAAVSAIVANTPIVPTDTSVSTSTPKPTNTPKPVELTIPTQTPNITTQLDVYIDTTFSQPIWNVDYSRIAKPSETRVPNEGCAFLLLP